MKKITKILSLTVVVASMMTPLALLANNSNSVNVKQEVNEVGSDATIESNNVNNDVEANNQAIDVNNTIDNDEFIGEWISSNSCTAEDSGQTTTTWMGITNDFVNFTVSKDYVSESNVGEVKITDVSSRNITSTYLKIPNYIVTNSDGKKYKVVEINDNSFGNCTGLIGTLTIPANVTSIGLNAFNDCNGLTSLDLTNATSLTTIGSEAFFTCTGLTGTLTIPASVTSIGRDVFLFCAGLKHLDFSSAGNLKNIGIQAFSNCTSLSGPLTIPASVTSIGLSAFQNCTGLTSLDLSNATNLTTIDFNVFNTCTGLTGPLTIPASVTTIKSGAFNGCTGLTGPLTIPASVTTLDDSAFYNIGCQDLNFLSETPPRSLGTNIFGTDVTKTLWVPNAQAKAAYDSFAVTNFGLADSSYIKVGEIVPTSVDITNLNGSYTINLNETNKTIATARADVQPKDATNKDVTWSLENAPIWLKIDVDGNIFANDDLKNATPDKFTFKVKVVCQANAVSNITNDIELNVIQQENTDSFAWWWLLVAEAGALLLIGVISISVIVVKNKKNK